MWDTSPVVTVVIPAWNAEAWLPQTLESVRGQTFIDWECIVVDDASPDGTAAVVERFAADDRRFKLIRHEKNRGPAAGRNTALEASRGRWVAMLDADDSWDSNKLEAQLKSLSSRPSAVWSHHGTRMVNDGRIEKEVPGSQPEDNARVEDFVLFNCAIWQSTAMIDRQALIDVGGWDTRFRGTEDWELWIRLVQRFGGESVVCLPDIMLNYRLLESSLSRSKYMHAREARRVIRHTLLRGGFMFRHPIKAIKMIDGELLRSRNRRWSDGDYGRAGLWAILYLLADPIRSCRRRETGRILNRTPARVPG